ncbi:hypothetical protein FOA43_000264 [Brettanomyces nanus]|uniref:Uncharacterized protein n=1 Tax=Eeniella nana TaxID=13502 RepID=A0A875RMZ2_EENNA|nr:uncharacterized protein FOA43_000264 [Brettanomyces nanus]QPG72960.1 hypothetical protein FOA43_000264 [Brettanomyces nanus]
MSHFPRFQQKEQLTDVSPLEQLELSSRRQAADHRNSVTQAIADRSYSSSSTVDTTLSSNSTTTPSSSNSDTFNGSFNLKNVSRQSLSSLLSTESSSTTGGLLAKLRLDDAEWEAVYDGEDDNISLTRRSTLQQPSPIDPTSISIPASQFRSLRPLLNSLKRKKFVNSAANSAKAMGNTVNRVRNDAPVLVSRADVQSIHIMRVSDGEEENDEDDDSFLPSPQATSASGDDTISNSTEMDERDTLFSSINDTEVTQSTPFYEHHDITSSSPAVAPITPPRNGLQKPVRGFGHMHSFSNPVDTTTLVKRKASCPDSPLAKTFHHKFYHATAPSPITGISDYCSSGKQAHSDTVLTPTSQGPIVLHSREAMDQMKAKIVIDNLNYQRERANSLLRTPSVPSLFNMSLDVAPADPSPKPPHASQSDPLGSSAKSSPLHVYRQLIHPSSSPSRMHTANASHSFPIPLPDVRSQSRLPRLPVSPFRPLFLTNTLPPLVSFSPATSLHKPERSVDSHHSAYAQSNNVSLSTQTISKEPLVQPPPIPISPLAMRNSCPSTMQSQTKTNSSLTPESRVSMAIALRKSGQSKEAAYQLQVAANQGNAEAMFLFGLSLRYGYGVIKDKRLSFLWICKSGGIVADKAYHFKVNPKIILDELGKGGTLLRPKEPQSSIFFEIGQAYLHGWGCRMDTKQSLQFFELSGSLGYCDAMCEAGKMWTNKRLNGVKRDLFRAASWFRLAECCGAELIGSEWIRKKKYD